MDSIDPRKIAEIESCLQQVEDEASLENGEVFLSAISSIRNGSLQGECPDSVKKLQNLVEPYAGNIQVTEKITRLVERIQTKVFAEKLGNLDLFHSIKNDRDEFDRIAKECFAIYSKEETRPKIGALLEHLQKRDYDPDFWEAPLFEDPNIDYYILLAHLEGSIKEEDVATLYAMTASLRHSRAIGAQFTTLPLFTEEGEINPPAFQYIMLTMQPLNPLNEEQVNEWFRRMRTLPPINWYFLAVHQPWDKVTKDRDLEASMPPEESYKYQVKMAQGLVQSNYSVIEVVSQKIHFNLFYRPTEMSRLIPPTQAYFILFEILRESSQWHFKQENARFQLGLGELSQMKEDHLLGKRVISVFPSFIHFPVSTDSRTCLHGGDFLMHDFYHCYVVGQIPLSHLRFFMIFGEEIDKYAKRENLTEEERILLNQTVQKIYDAEYIFYRKDKNKDRPQDTSMKMTYERLLNYTPSFEASINLGYSYHAFRELSKRDPLVRKHLVNCTRPAIDRYLSIYPDPAMAKLLDSLGE